MFAVQDLNVGPFPVKRDDRRPLGAHVWAKEALGFYVEPQWCSERLFQVEQFDGAIWDPACGLGRITEAARRVGYTSYATDIVDRGYQHFKGCVISCGMIARTRIMWSAILLSISATASAINLYPAADVRACGRVPELPQARLAANRGNARCRA
jgi:hypothetical protein